MQRDRNSCDDHEPSPQTSIVEKAGRIPAEADVAGRLMNVCS
jgi:hypothetical protein